MIAIGILSKSRCGQRSRIFQIRPLVTAYSWEVIGLWTKPSYSHLTSKEDCQIKPVCFCKQLFHSRSLVNIVLTWWSGSYQRCQQSEALPKQREFILLPWTTLDFHGDGVVNWQICFDRIKLRRAYLRKYISSFGHNLAMYKIYCVLIH